ncbi:MAG: MBL fold metallo-hydrolase [Fimbriimonadaceae bacterium]|nr:MBL fold metallo-hydrolase [Fimbriimonadaceae bacterium]
MANRIQFCGAAQTVTGSRHLITTNGKKILVDCGLFQGRREIRERNWEPFPIDPREIDAIVLTHAHTDHLGFLPVLVKLGYRGPIYSTKATLGLARISLPDSGRLQEEDARYRNKHGYSRHKPALPLYTEKDAYACLKQFHTVKYRTNVDLPGKAIFRYSPAGHILGSAFIELFFENGERIVMSGDVGRYDTPIIKDPCCVDFGEYLVMESTYGDRLHEQSDPEGELERVIGDAVRAGSVVLLPSFAIGRTQEVLYYVKKLQDSGKIPRVPIFVDSPMATKATVEYLNQTEEHDEEAKLAFDMNDNPIEPALLEFVRDRDMSKMLNSRKGPMMIIAGSGMANGGRILHHLLHRIEDPSTIVVFTGYQAEGTLGREILDGAPEIEIFRRTLKVSARIERLHALSAHADQAEMMQWLGDFKQPPKKTFLVHGEPAVQEVFRDKIVKELGWKVEIPKHLEAFDLV